MEINDVGDKLKARLERYLRETTFDDLTVSGSKFRFEMALAITSGQGNAYEPLLTVDQYLSGVYEVVIE